jgi:hypothetical protein
LIDIKITYSDGTSDLYTHGENLCQRSSLSFTNGSMYSR